jgi:hypothetical protein
MYIEFGLGRDSMILDLDVQVCLSCPLERSCTCVSWSNITEILLSRAILDRYFYFCCDWSLQYLMGKRGVEDPRLRSVGPNKGHFWVEWCCCCWWC